MSIPIDLIIFFFFFFLLIYFGELTGILSLNCMFRASPWILVRAAAANERVH